MSSNEKTSGYFRKKTISFGLLAVAALTFTSVILGVAGVNLSKPYVTELVAVNALPPNYDPFDKFWDQIASIRSSAPSYFHRENRQVTVKAAVHDGYVYLLIEWPDNSPDMSFLGPKEQFQQEELLRDEMEFFIAPADSKGSPLAVVAANSIRHGYLAWKSQWKFNAEKHQLEVIRKRFPRDYVDYYPFAGDLAYLPPLAVGNTNTIYDLDRPIMWLTGRPYYESSETEISATSAWKEDRWRVLMRLDGKKDLSSSNTVFVLIRLADGGKDERNSFRAVSQIVKLSLSREQ